MIVCVLKWLLTMHIWVEGLDCVLVWKIKVYKQVGVVHVLSMFMGFDMGSFLVGHNLDNHNHRMNSQVSKYRGPKPYKVTIFKFGLGAEKGWVTWKYKQYLHWMCIYTTCTYSWILRRWMRWFAYPSRMEHFQKCGHIKCNN
jgi:hypothetical protein